MRTALVTGASGMLGSAITERLVAEGWIVRALVRDPAGACWLAEKGAELRGGDLTDRASVRAAARGCDVIFHAAAAIGTGSGWRAFEAANVSGTAHVVDAAAGAGARLVHVSSTAVYGANRYHPLPTDESFPLPELPAHDAYGRSKQEAERVVAEAHGLGLVWATIVRPPVMYGPRDRQFVPRVGPVFLRGLFPLIRGGGTRLPLVAASAVADGAVRAARCAHAGGRVYLLTHDATVTVADLAAYAARGLGRRVLTPPVGLAAGRAAFRVLEYALWLGRRRDLAAHAAGTFRMLTLDDPFTSERARRELGWAPRTDPATAIPEAFRWWLAARGVRAGVGRRG